jgi:hypothetical protein
MIHVGMIDSSTYYANGSERQSHESYSGSTYRLECSSQKLKNKKYF